MPDERAYRKFADSDVPKKSTPTQKVYFQENSLRMVDLWTKWRKVDAYRSVFSRAVFLTSKLFTLCRWFLRPLSTVRYTVIAAYSWVYHIEYRLSMLGASCSMPPKCKGQKDLACLNRFRPLRLINDARSLQVGSNQVDNLATPSLCEQYARVWPV